MNKTATPRVARLSDIFTLTQMPANVRVNRWAERVFLERIARGIMRRLSSCLLGTPLISNKGRFDYRRGNDTCTVTFNGRNMQFHALYENRFRHGYEIETGLLLSRLCRGSSAFYDIGSNWGYFSLLMATIAEFTGPIIAFEPNPQCFVDLNSTIRQAGLKDRVRTCQFGLGRESCTMKLVEADKFNTGLSRLAAHGSGRLIPVKRLDDLDFPKPIMLKIDAEGMEADVLAGGTKLLETACPFVLFESWLNYDSPKQTLASLEILRSHGYRLFLPVLMFSKDDKTVMTTYGVDPEALFDSDSEPKLGLFEVTTANRYLFAPLLNILAVPPTRIAEIWAAGCVNLNDVPMP